MSQIDSLPPEAVPNEHLLAAARAAVAWARARQEDWNRTDAGQPARKRRVEPPRPAPAVAAPPPIVVAPPPIVVAPPPVVVAPPAAPPEPIVEEPLLDEEPEAEERPAIHAPTALAGDEDLAADEALSSRGWAVAQTRTAIDRLRRLLVPAAIAILIIVIAAGVGVGAKKGLDYWQRRAAALKTGVAVLDSEPAGSDVLVDGERAGTTPLTATLSAGAHTIEFRSALGDRFVHITVPGGGRVEQSLDWSQKPTGSLTVTTSPAGAHVLVDGRAYGVTPLTIDALVAGPHVVTIRGSQGTVQRTISVDEGKTTTLDEAITNGWVKVLAPFDVTVTEGDRSLWLDDYTVMLPAGTHTLHFENKQFGFAADRQVVVHPGGQTTLSLQPPPAMLTVSGPAGCEVSIDGKSVGVTPLVNQPIELGLRDVIVKSPAGDQRRFTLTVTPQPITLTVDFTAPSSGP